MMVIYLYMAPWHLPPLDYINIDYRYLRLFMIDNDINTIASLLMPLTYFPDIKIPVNVFALSLHYVRHIIE